MATKEIVTLQLGNYANFIGTHWWNIQESSFKYNDDGITDDDANHDVLFREGQTDRGEVTFTPRLVLAELKGGLGSLKMESILYGDGPDAKLDHGICWEGTTTLHKEEPVERNKFLMDLDNGTNHEHSVSMNGKPPPMETVDYNLDSEVRVWSDYLRPYLHPKSMVMINEYSHTAENDPFDLWSKGAALRGTCEELEERIRFYAEECDFMQGFHILSDMHTGFAGLTSTMVRYLHDEFPLKELCVFPSYPASFPNDSKQKRLKRQLTQSLCLSTLSEHSSLLCPVSLWSPLLARDNKFPHLSYDSSLHYHSSAILASSLDTATMKYRTRNNSGVNLRDFRAGCTSMGRSLTSLSLCMPIPLADGSSASQAHSFMNFSHFLNSHLEKEPWSSLSPNPLEDHVQMSPIECYAQFATMRGISQQTDFVPQDDRTNAFIPCRSTADMLKLYLDKRWYGSCNAACAVSEPLSLAAPFPQIFTEDVTPKGFLRSKTGHLSALTYRRKDPAHQNGGTGEHNGTNGLVDKSTPNISAASRHQSLRTPVESVSLMANVQCSSRSAGVLKSAANCLRQGRKRYLSFHLLENDNMDNEIEHLQTLHDDYKSSVAGTESSDSDTDF